VAQDLFDEFACVRLLRLIKNLARITSFDHMAAVHENDFGRDRYVKQGQVQVRMTKTASNMHAAHIIGERSLRDIMRGRYHRPRAEERFFLFVDVVGSTPVAERMGPLAVHRYLNRVFQVASDPVDAHGGEIYQYVGDEMVVTWTVAEGRPGARPLACLFAIEAALIAEAPGFEGEFGTVPKIRAALHAGEVVTGEIGGSRRAIVFHGDVMNTTSRIENATRNLGRNYLISEDALARLDGAARYAPEDLGPQQLRGREALIRLYGVRAA